MGPDAAPQHILEDNSSVTCRISCLRTRIAANSRVTYGVPLVLKSLVAILCLACLDSLYRVATTPAISGWLLTMSIPTRFCPPIVTHFLSALGRLVITVCVRPY